MINQILTIPDWRKYDTFTNSNTPPSNFSQIYPGPDKYWYSKESTGVVKRFALDYQFVNGFNLTNAATDSFVNYRVDINPGSGLTFSYDGINSQLLVQNLTASNLYLLNSFTQGFVLSYNTISQGFQWIPNSTQSITGTTGSLAKFTSGNSVGDSLLYEESGKVFLGITPSNTYPYIGMGISPSINIGGRIYLNNNLNRYLDGTSNVELRTTSDFAVNSFPLLSGTDSVGKFIDARTDLATFSNLGYDRQIEFLSGLVSVNQRPNLPALFVNATPPGLSGASPSNMVRTPTFSFTSTNPFLGKIVGTFGVALGLSSGGIQIKDGTEGQYKVLVSSTTQGHGIWANMVDIGSARSIPIYQRTGDFNVSDRIIFTDSVIYPTGGSAYGRTFSVSLSIVTQSIANGFTTSLNNQVNFVIPNVGATGSIEFLMSHGLQTKYGTLRLYDQTEITGAPDVNSQQRGVFIKDLSNTGGGFERGTRSNSIQHILTSVKSPAYGGLNVYGGGMRTQQAWQFSGQASYPIPRGYTTGWTTSQPITTPLDTFSYLARPGFAYFPRSIYSDSILFTLPQTTLFSDSLGRNVYANPGYKKLNHLSTADYVSGLDTQIVRHITNQFTNQDWSPVGSFTAGITGSFTTQSVPNVVYEFNFNRMGYTGSNLRMDTVLGKWLRLESGEFTGSLTQSTGLFINPQIGSFKDSGVFITASRVVGVQVAQEVGILNYQPAGLIREAYDFISARIANGNTFSGINSHVGFFAQSKLLGQQWDPTGRRFYDYGQRLGNLNDGDRAIFTPFFGRFAPGAWPTFSVYPQKPWGFFAEKDKSNFGGGVLIDIGATFGTSLNAYLEIQGVTGIFNTFSNARQMFDLDGSIVTVSGTSYGPLLPQILLRPGLTPFGAPTGSLFYTPGFLGFVDGGVTYNLIPQPTTTSGGVTGFGVPGYVPVWTNSFTLRGTSSLYVSNAGAGNVGINTLSPNYPLQIGTSSTQSLIASGITPSLWNVALGLSGSILYQDGSHGSTGSVLMADSTGRTNLYPLVLPGPGVTASFARVGFSFSSGYLPLYSGLGVQAGPIRSSEYQLGPIMTDQNDTSISLLIRPQAQFASSNPLPTATFTASISGDTMTVVSVLSGNGVILAPSRLTGPGLVDGTRIIENLTGTGSTGTYRVNIPQTLGNSLITSTLLIRNMTFVVPSLATTIPSTLTASVEFVMNWGNQTISGLKSFSNQTRFTLSDINNVANTGILNQLGSNISLNQRLVGMGRAFSTTSGNPNYVKSILTRLVGSNTHFYSRPSLTDTLASDVGAFYQLPTNVNFDRKRTTEMDQVIGRLTESVLANNYFMGTPMFYRDDVPNFIGQFDFTKVTSTHSNLNNPRTFVGTYKRTEFGHNFATAGGTSSGLDFIITSSTASPLLFSTSSVNLMTGLFVNNQIGGATWSYASATYSIGVYSRQDVDSGRISRAYDFFASRMGASSSLSRIDNQVGFYAQSKVFGTTSLDPTGRNVYSFDGNVSWPLTFSYGWTSGNNAPWSFFAESDKAGFGGGILIMGTNSDQVRAVNATPSYEDILGVYRNGNLPSWLTIQEALSNRTQISLLTSDIKARATIQIVTAIPSGTQIQITTNYPQPNTIVVPTFSTTGINTTQNATQFRDQINNSASGYTASSVGQVLSISAPNYQGSAINGSTFSFSAAQTNFVVGAFSGGVNAPVPLTTSDGDMWHTGTALYFKSGGATYNLISQIRGVTGPTGPAGANGLNGADGINGSRNGLVWVYSTSTAPSSFPSPAGSFGVKIGNVIFDSTTAFTKMYINTVDASTTFRDSYIQTWAPGDILTWNLSQGLANTNAVSLRLGTQSPIFGSASGNFQYIEFSVTKLGSGNPGVWTNNSLISLLHQPIGPTGATGLRGATGATGVASIGAFSPTTFYAQGIDLSTTGVLTLGAANQNNPGIVHTSAQTFAGNKTFRGTVSIGPTNASGLALFDGSGLTYSGFVGPTGLSSNIMYRLPPVATTDRFLKLESTSGETYNLVWGTVSSPPANESILSGPNRIIVGKETGAGLTFSNEFRICLSTMDMIASQGSTISVSGTDVCQNVIIGGQDHNIEKGLRSAIIGGFNGTVSCAQSSVIIGGINNYIKPVSGGGIQPAASIIGGECNVINSACFAGGNFNHNMIGGGSCNLIENNSLRSSIIGGCLNTICTNLYNSSILGGNCNLICNASNRSSIIGGSNNIMANSSNAALVSGSENCICSNSGTSVIVGGQCSLICQSCNSSLFGGCRLAIVSSSKYSAIVGGCSNTMSNSCGSAIIAGRGNTMSACNSVILGGTGLTLSTNNMVYVPELMINNVSNVENGQNILWWSAVDKKVYYRQFDNFPFGSGGGGGGTISTVCVNSSGVVNGATVSYSGGFATLTFGAATKNFDGIVTTQSQTISGTKSFFGNVFIGDPVATQPTGIYLYEYPGNQYTGFISPKVLDKNYVYQLPEVKGITGQSLMISSLVDNGTTATISTTWSWPRLGAGLTQSAGGTISLVTLIPNNIVRLVATPSFTTFTASLDDNNKLFDVTTGDSLFRVLPPLSFVSKIPGSSANGPSLEYSGYEFRVRKNDFSDGVVSIQIGTNSDLNPYISLTRQNQMVGVKYDSASQSWTGYVIDNGYVSPNTVLGNFGTTHSYVDEYQVVDLNDAVQKAPNYTEGSFDNDWLSGLVFSSIEPLQYRNVTGSKYWFDLIVAEINGTITPPPPAGPIYGLSGSFIGTNIFPAYSLTRGKTIRLKMSGTHSNTNGSQFSEWNFVLGGVTMSQFTYSVFPQSSTSSFYLEYDIKVRNGGLSGSVYGSGKIIFDELSGGSPAYTIHSFNQDFVQVNLSAQTKLQVLVTNVSQGLLGIKVNNTTIERLG